MQLDPVTLPFHRYPTIQGVQGYVVPHIYFLQKNTHAENRTVGFGQTPFLSLSGPSITPLWVIKGVAFSGLGIWTPWNFPRVPSIPTKNNQS